MPCGATQDGQVMVERSDRMWSTGEGNGKPLQNSCLENPMNSRKRQIQHYTLPQKTEYTFFLSIYGSVSGADHILGNKISLNKFKSIEIISSVFSDYSGIQLEVIHRKWNGKKATTWKLKNILLNTNISMMTILNLKISWDKWQWYHNHTNSMRCSKISS